MHSRLIIIAGLTALAAGIGCGSKYPRERLAPVTGKISVDGQPLKMGTVSFRPMKDKGNTSLNEPAGEIEEDGTYTIFTQGKEGAPAGMWKVIVSSRDPIDPQDPYKPTKSHVPAKYELIDKTDLKVEVVDAPAGGAYDLKLSGKN
jgi:hypothetical protein